ncbi:DUF2711 family protein [Microbulbifer aggregans]|uniref:DUF2711 family protein n=1 Tax=Microbulbifer aggregans TaxID=1769779 RepID=UPI001CFC8398|nr:DUF2711 family protein [Microbulbifer aggregans]
MTERVLPTPEKFASCPYDEKILPFYEGQFEAVYVMLHPFLKPDSLNIERFWPGKWPAKQEIINGCSAISWQDILRLTKLSSLADIDVGLRTSIGGIKKELSNEYTDPGLKFNHLIAIVFGAGFVVIPMGIMLGYISA